MTKSRVADDTRRKNISVWYGEGLNIILKIDLYFITLA